MLIKKCDLCKRNAKRITTIILHKKTFDYCNKCKPKADKILEEFRKIMKLEYLEYEEKLKKEEKIFYKNVFK